MLGLLQAQGHRAKAPMEVECTVKVQERADLFLPQEQFLILGRSYPLHSDPMTNPPRPSPDGVPEGPKLTWSKVPFRKRIMVLEKFPFFKQTASSHNCT